MICVTSRELRGSEQLAFGARSLLARMTMANMAHLDSRFASHAGVTEELAASIAPAMRRDDLLAMPIEERILGPSIRLGRAHELVASLCRALAEVLSIEAVEALRSSLPTELVAWLDPPTLAIDGATRSTWTLASGRPGSSHPISEAHPDPKRPIR